MTDPVALWNPPAPARVRGTLAVIGGRGESARVYERFATRLASDGYAVGVFESGEADAAVAWAADAAAPRVLVGADLGATAVLAALVAAADIDGAILAGTLVEPATAEPADAAERTACPVHLGVLAEPAAQATAPATGADLPDAATLAAVSAPVFAVHGGADTVAPPAAASAYLAGLPQLQLVQTVGGLHDALNDQSHRSVAAHIVLWLERLRAGDAAAPIVRELSGVAS